MDKFFKKSQLEDLGFNKFCKGFGYLYEAINIRIKHPDKSVTSICNHIALRVNRQYDSIQRCIENCIESSNSEFKNQSVSLAISNLALKFIN